MIRIETEEQKKLVTSAYVLPKDFEAITLCTKEYNIGVSFRRNKEEALKMLERGAGTKPHHILEKSLSREGLKKRGITEVPAELEPFLGLVPNWNPDAENNPDACLIKGFYITNEGKKFFNTHHRRVVQTEDKKAWIAVVSDKAALTELSSFLEKEYVLGTWARLFITGDYDMHDLVLYTSQRSPIPSDSADEKKVIKALNDAMQASDKEHFKIQHGPQYSYIAHMKAEEAGRDICRAVAEPDLPVAFCARGEWTILNTQEDLENFYRDQKINLKWTWIASKEAKTYMKNISAKA